MMNNKGNALFLILIAVALFAALSYAVTQSGRGGGTIDREQSIIDATQYVDWSTSLKNTVMRMTLTGTSTANLTFFSAWPFPCTTGEDCVFAPEGGGATWTAPSGVNWFYWGVNDGMAVSGVGTTADDGILVVNSNNIPTNICEQINKGLGLAVPVAGNSFLWAGAVDIDAYPGEEAACFATLTIGSIYNYYHVLVAQ